MVEALKVMVQASSNDSVDTAKLAVLVQNAQGSDERDDFDADMALKLLLRTKVIAVPSWRLWRTCRRHFANCDEEGCFCEEQARS